MGTNHKLGGAIRTRFISDSGGSASIPNYLVGVETRDAQIDVAYPYLKFEDAKAVAERIAAALNENRLPPEIPLPHATREPARDTRWRLKVLAWGGVFILATLAGAFWEISSRHA